MQVVRLLHKRSAHFLSTVDPRQITAVWCAVTGLLIGKRLWLTALGRHLPTRALEKHSIKRIDRLLGRASMSAERTRWYRWLCSEVLRGVPEPVVVVDWSPLDSHGRLHLLRAAVAVGGRAVPIYERVHSRCNDPRFERSFLRQLKAVLGRGCRPIVVTDAGFRADWFEQVEQMGWRYVGRILGVLSVKVAPSGRWMRNARLYPQADSVPKALGAGLIRQSAPFATYLYLYARAAKGRVKRTARGTRERSARSQKHQCREAKPWLLVSNLEPSDSVACEVVKLYHTRMQIEEGFRDLKSSRHGFALRQNIGRDRQRVANLLLLAALGTLATWLMGLHGEARGLVSGLQANTESTRRVLSTFFVGRRLLEKRLRLGPKQLERALHRLRQDILSQPIEIPT